MRNVLAFVIALGIVVAIFWFTRSDKPAPRSPAVVASGSQTTPARTTTTATATPTASDKPGATKVRRLDREARKQLGERIAAAREQARARARAAGEPVADDAMTLEDVSAPLQEKLREALPLLAECYQREGTLEALAMMTLTTDPELGTVIDTDAITDAGGEPLARELDACLREAIDSLALPPLGPKGGKLPLQYTFRFE